QTMARFTDEVDGLAFSSDGNTLAIATGKRVRLWSLAAQRELAQLEGRTDRVGFLRRSPLAFTPVGPNILAAAADDHTISLWDVTTHAVVTTLRGLTQEIHAL